MAVFAVIAPEPDPRLEEAVTREFEGRYFRIAPTQFLLSAPRATTSQVADRLGASAGKVGRVLILRLGNFTGWHGSDLWEWIAAQNVAPTSPMEPGDETDE